MQHASDPTDNRAYLDKPALIEQLRISVLSVEAQL